MCGKNKEGRPHITLLLFVERERSVQKVKLNCLVNNNRSCFHSGSGNYHSIIITTNWGNGCINLIPVSGMYERRRRKKKMEDWGWVRILIELELRWIDWIGIQSPLLMCKASLYQSQCNYRGKKAKSAVFHPGDVSERNQILINLILDLHCCYS